MTSVHVLLLRIGTRLVLRLPKQKIPVLAVQTMSPRAMKVRNLDTPRRKCPRRFQPREYVRMMKVADASISLMIPILLTKKRKKSMIYFKKESHKIFEERNGQTFKGTVNPP
jgi:hypothetical protein